MGCGTMLLHPLSEILKARRNCRAALKRAMFCSVIAESKKPVESLR